MREYRCYFMNTAKMITTVEVVECANDDEAQQAALRLLRERSPYAIEVWDEARKIFHARGPDPETNRPDTNVNGLAARHGTIHVGRGGTAQDH